MLEELEASLHALQGRPPAERLPLLLQVCIAYCTTLLDIHNQQVADRAFAMGVRALHAGKRAQATQLLLLAQTACPETKVNARRKIQTALQACETS